MVPNFESAMLAGLHFCRHLVNQNLVTIRTNTKASAEKPDEEKHQLKDFPLVIKGLDEAPEELLIDLHFLLFQTSADSGTLKEKILEFDGFSFNLESEEYEERKEILQRMPGKLLTDVSRAFSLGVMGKREETIENILAFLMKPAERFLKAESSDPVILSDVEELDDFDGFSDSDDSITCEVIEKKVECIDLMAPKKKKVWDANNMKMAIMAVRSKRIGLRLASRYFDVPRSTLKDKVNSKETDIDKLVGIKPGRKPVLDSELERSLVKHCLDMEARFYSLTAKDVKKLAYDLAEKNLVQHRFVKGNGSAGWKWLYSFMKRHPELNFRMASLNLAGFTQVNVKHFFDIYEPLLDEINRDPERLYNCDETGLAIFQEAAEVIALKGKHQVGAISSEKGCLVTIVTCMSAAGHFIPPLLVFPRENQKPDLLDGAPNGSRAVYNKSGWIDAESFLKWFQEQFLVSVKPSKEHPVILVLDGSYSHTRNLALLESAKENGVHIVSLPPDCSRKMQPLETAFIHPLKTYYGQEIKKWLEQNAGRVVTHFQVTKLLSNAYQKAATVAVAERGFRITGLYPLDRNIFRPDEYAVVDSVESSYHQRIPNDYLSTSEASFPLRQGLIEPQPGPSGLQPAVTQRVFNMDLKPLPQINVLTKKQKKPRKRGQPSRSAAADTSSPYKRKLSAAITKKEVKKCCNKKM